MTSNQRLVIEDVLGTWELKNNELYLIGFDSSIAIKYPDSDIIDRRVDLNYLFPEDDSSNHLFRASSIKADWFTGYIVIQKDKTIIGRLMEYIISYYMRGMTNCPYTNKRNI